MWKKPYELAYGDRINPRAWASPGLAGTVTVQLATEHGGDQVRIRVRNGRMFYSIEVHRDTEIYALLPGDHLLPGHLPGPERQSGLLPQPPP